MSTIKATFYKNSTSTIEIQKRANIEGFALSLSVVAFLGQLKYLL